MTYFRQIVAQINRFGREVEVHTRSETGQNDFGNVQDDHIYDRDVIAFQTYPNRNTQIQTGSGDRDRDNPVFLVPNTDDQVAPPEPDDVIIYDDQKYEVKSHTRYDTHVEFFGDPVIHDESGI
jgi:hypothetical protein